MWWGIGFGALIWIVLFVWLGIRTLRNGHGWMFFLGIFFPLLWIIEAVVIFAFLLGGVRRTRVA